VNGCGFDSPGLEQNPITGSYEQGNEYLGPIKGWKFLEMITNYRPLKKRSPAWS
jgi:hypothetical protein